MCSKKVNNDDRISSLPDDVLCHILSFLPTKYSVRTTILSTRWKLLFTFVPILYFEYFSPSTHSSSPTFIQFVNSLFIWYNVSRMNKFHLDFVSTEDYPDHCPIFSWISSAIFRQVQVIDIKVIIVCADLPMSLPLDLFSCKTLTDLRLNGDFNIVLPSSVCLPCLRTCSLVGVEFFNESARSLFRNCPALEKLDISRCIGVKILDVSSHTLKHFRIFVRDDDDFQLVLNVPNLVYFEYHAEGYVETEFSGLESLKSVVEAAILYDQNTFFEDGVSVELVQGLRHVEKLSLLCGPMEGFLLSGHSLPTFNSLTHLFFGPMSNLASKLLSGLLDNSPQLEFLEFNQRFGDRRDGADQNDYALPEHVPTCVSLHLREVQFMNFRMLQYECKLIKYFLKHAKNLETMQIQSNRSWDEQFEISSAACRIVYLPEDIEGL